MKRILAFLLALLALPACLLSAASGEEAPDRPSLRVLIIPKFEIGDMSGDFPGEAQLFYERYTAGCPEAEIPHMPPNAHFYVNPANGVGLLLTGSCKTAATLSLTAVLSSGAFDFSGAYLVSVGCAGGSASACALGDVVVVTSVCDYDLGHHVDAHEKEKTGTRVMWFPDDSFADYNYKQLSADLCEKVYGLVRNCPLRTTEQSKRVMAENAAVFGQEEVLPSVRKGTALTGDNYWKGLYGHATADFIAQYYKCPDPYAVTEMEEIAVANAAECFGLLDRLISLRVVVNMDVFLAGATPESTWGEYDSFSAKVQDENTETLDIFEPAMQNLADAGCLVIDSILAGDF